jgi:murein L,D-transpeptidase YcbB/YkuD
MKTKTILSLTLIPVVLFIAGCATTKNYQKAEGISQSLEKTAQVINETNVQVGIVTSTLGSLIQSSSNNIKPQFEKFDTELTKLNSLAEAMYAQSVAIQTEGNNYFKNWEQDLATIKNESIRTRSTQRKLIMAERFETVRTNYEKAKVDLSLYLSNLKDVRTALASDLRSEGLKSVQGATNDSQDHSKQLQRTLSRLSVDYNELSVSMSTTDR